MKLRNIVAGTLICGIFLGLAAVASAGPPRQGGDPPPPQPGFEPVPIQPGKLVVDRSTGRIVQVELTPAESSLPSGLIGGTDAVSKSDGPASPSFPPRGPTGSSGGPEGRTRTAVSERPPGPSDVLPGSPASGENAGDEVSIAASTTITTQGFEGTFPSGLWNANATGSPHQWGKVNCFPAAGSWSAWPAANVANPCGGASYPNNMAVWLEYGPFSLVGAQSASLDFYFRMASQSCSPITNCDYFFWGASLDDVNFYGDFAAGTYTGGLYQNGYNFASLDLSWLAGQPNVWIGFAFYSNGDGITGQGPFVDAISLRKNTDPRQYLTDQNFDVEEFPNPSWIGFDNDTVNGEYFWDDVQCFARSGDWSMWPADEGANGLDPCFALDPYANNMDSWLVHGPFSLIGASEAWVDFYFRNESELGLDRFWWMASTDEVNYTGFFITGDYAVGPYGNGYNLMRFDLSDPGLGDLRGEPEVWLAFSFDSDGSVTDRGPFVDDVRVVVERPSGMPSANNVYLPLVESHPVLPTNLYITNHTGGNLTYTVFGTPQGNKSCTVLNNQEKLCATFTSGTYNWQAKAVCGTKTGTRTYPPGDDHPKPFECQ
jgi:hypothetical protein